MKIGDMRNRLALERETSTPDGMGGQTVTWLTVATVWAAIWPLKTVERMAAMKIEGELTHRIRIRYRENVTGSMRGTCKGKTYLFDGPPLNLNNEGRYLEIPAREIA